MTAAGEAPQAVSRRLRPLYITAFLQGFVFWYAIEKLRMRQMGFSDYLITVSVATYIVVMTLANIPLGMLADWWSRKGVLNIGTAALAASSLVCWLSDSFWPYVAGISLWGVFYACQTGTFDAIVYDVVLEERGTPDGFERYYGRVQMCDFAANLAGCLTSVAVVHFTSLRSAFVLSIPVTCCAFVSLSRFREPVLHRRPAGLSGSRARQITKVLLTRPAIAWIAASMVLDSVAFRVLFELGQLWYIALALPVVFFGAGAALLCLGATAGGFLADRLPGKLRGSRPPALLACLLTAAASTGLFVREPALVLGAQLLAIAGVTALGVVLAGYLHDQVPSAVRSGTSSVVTTAGYVAFVPVALSFGAVTRTHSVFAASWFVLVPVAVMAAVLSLMTLRDRVTRSLRWRLATIAASVAVLLAVCGYAGYQVAERTSHPGHAAAPLAGPARPVIAGAAVRRPPGRRAARRPHQPALRILVPSSPRPGIQPSPPMSLPPSPTSPAPSPHLSPSRSRTPRASPPSPGPTPSSPGSRSPTPQPSDTATPSPAPTPSSSSPAPSPAPPCSPGEAAAPARWVPVCSKQAAAWLAIGHRPTRLHPRPRQPQARSRLATGDGGSSRRRWLAASTAACGQDFWGNALTCGLTSLAWPGYTPGLQSATITTIKERDRCADRSTLPAG
jgi:MFS family permease